MEFKSEQYVVEMFKDFAESLNTNLSGCTAYVSTAITDGCIQNKGVLVCPDKTELKCEVKLDSLSREIIDIHIGTCWIYLDNDEATDKDLQAKSKTLITAMSLLAALPFNYQLKL